MSGVPYYNILNVTYKHPGRINFHFFDSTMPKQIDSQSTILKTNEFTSKSYIKCKFYSGFKRNIGVKNV